MMSQPLCNLLLCGKSVATVTMVYVVLECSVKPDAVYKTLYKMVRSCCAVDCTTRNVKETREAGIHFYRIPQDEMR